LGGKQFPQRRGRFTLQDTVLPATIRHSPPDGRGRTLRVRHAPRKIAATLLLDLLVELISRQQVVTLAFVENGRWRRHGRRNGVVVVIK
jgi:hypothetical protein